MKITRTRTLHIQPRQYESIDVSATIEFDSEDDIVSIKEFADDALTALLEDEITQAAAVTDNPKSFIATYRYSGE